ncbi:MAG: hypothetical protein WA584_23320 [Pyrinomonadaceae bacterium]
MPIDPTKLAKLQEISRTGKPKVCEVLRVKWTQDITKYYATSAFDRVPPFTDIKNYLGGEHVDARLVQSGFHSFELAPDLTTEEIPLTFADADEAVNDLFEAHGGNVKATLCYFYPDCDLFLEVWWGVLNEPELSVLGVLQTTASNGFRSREEIIPSRLRSSEECSSIFGGETESLTEYRGIGCLYNLQHDGGTIGNLDPDGNPYTSCPKDLAGCTARGMTDYRMVFPTSVAPVVSDPRNPGYLASTKGNADRLTNPIRVIAGIKTVRDLPILLFRNENTASDPNHSWVRLIAEVGEGPMEAIDQVKISLGTDAAASLQYLITRKGDYAQAGTNYGGAGNYSCTAVLQHVLGYVPANTPQSFVTASCRAKGYKEVRVYSDETTYAEQWENNRVWWLLCLYTNLRFGSGYSYSIFDIQSFIAAAEWTAQYVRFTAVRADGSTVNYDHYRSKFDAVLEGRQTQEQIIDICRSGRLSVPFQSEGKYTITPLKKWDDLETCRVFTDKGPNRNIVFFDGEGENTGRLPIQSIRLSKTPNSKLVNHITLKYEDGSKNDREVTLTVDDKVQKKKAARVLGDVAKKIQKTFVAFGVRVRGEAVKLGQALLDLGEFDTGGIKNNQKAEFTVIFEQALGLKREEVIKLESNRLKNSPFEYFRVKKMRKASNHLVTITAQAYPVDYYETFETEIEPPEPPTEPPGGGDGPVCRTTLGTIEYEAGVFRIPIGPC